MEQQAYEDDREDRDMSLVKRHAAQLSEHFDSVHIFCTRYEGECTVNCHYGEGNWFARYGHVRTWMLKEEQSFRNMADKSDDRS